MQEVATYGFSVPVAESAITYDGDFISVELARAAYAPGQRVRMIIKVWTWTNARWIDIWWGSIIKAYNTAGQLLTQVAASHLAIPGVDDYETYDVDLDLGTQPPEGLSGRLELWCEGSPEVKVATVQFGVPLIGEAPPGEAKPFPWLPVGLGAGVIAAFVLIATKSR